MEIWKQIKGYEGYYDISNTGKVKSVKRREKVSRGRVSTKKEIILKTCLNRYGYPTVTLVVNKKYKGFLLHRLLAINFIPNPNNYSIVNHIDGNKQNFQLNNLEWTTASLNQKHAYDNGLRKKKISEKDKELIVSLNNSGLTYLKIAEKFKVSQSLIGKICKDNKEKLKQ